MPYRVLIGLLLVVTPASADTRQSLVQLIEVPGVSGYEGNVRAAIAARLPAASSVVTDNIGNLLLRLGGEASPTLVVAPLDEPGFLVSAITDDGYLRVHRPGSGPGVRLWAQFFAGQPIQVLTSAGGRVPGVTATPSSHLRGLNDPAAEARIKTIDDLWIDVGAESRADVERLGIRLLDSITLRDRGHALAFGQVSGIAAASRAAALALTEVARRSAGRAVSGGVVLAWTAQSEFGQRGLVRLLETLSPARVIVLGGAPNPGEDPRGLVGELGAGPVVRDGGISLPEKWKHLPLRSAHVPVMFAQTPVETVDPRDVDALAEWVAREAGIGTLPPPGLADASDVEGTDAAASAPEAARGAGASPVTARTGVFDILPALIETYGVSGHEGPVRDQILQRLPAWAKPQVDEAGNVTVTFGRGGKPLLFVAHMDEVGLEIASINPDGTAAVRTRGGMYLSLWGGASGAGANAGGDGGGDPRTA